MPIVGLSDRGEAFPVIGKIRKGAKKRKVKKGDREIEIFGEELTYFRVEWAEGESDAAWMFESIYGKTPNEIRVIFPFNDIVKVWDPWKMAFTAGTILGKSDGKFVHYLQDNKGNVLVSNGLDKSGNKMPHPADDVAGFDFEGKPVKFKNSGILKVLILELPRAAYLEVITSSTNDIANISSQLAAFYALNAGQLAGIPFVLRRVPRMVSTPNKEGPRVRRKKYLISIEVDPKWVERMFGKLRTIALPEYAGEGVVVAELPAGEKLETEFDSDEELEEVTESDSTPEPAEESKEIRMVEVLGEEAVKFASGKWNCSRSEAAKELAKKNLGKVIAWDDLVQIVDPQPA